MAAHAVAEDAHAVRIHLFEVFEDGLGQLRGDVAVHLVSLAPRGFGRVDVEARAASEIKRVVLALDLEASCDRIRYNSFRTNGRDYLGAAVRGLVSG